MPTEDFQMRYQQIAGFHYVSPIQGTGMQGLVTELMQVTLKQKYMGEQIPNAWLMFEEKVLQ